MSTKTTAEPTTALFDLDGAWALHPQVAVRPERFGALLYHFGTRRLSFLKSPQLLTVVRSLGDHPTAREACLDARHRRGRAAVVPDRAGHPRGFRDDHRSEFRVTAVLPLVDQFALGLDAPICLTWELTYACNLSCRHCLSSSGRRDPRELSTAQCKDVIDTLERMQVFYVNIGGGEPTVRPDFWELVDYATEHHVGVKFSTNGVKIDAAEVAARLAGERLRRRADLARRRDRRGQRRGAGCRVHMPPRCGRCRTWPTQGSAGSRSRSS